jgi:D-3-phosphoglycerate dehydrogenase
MKIVMLEPLGVAEDIVMNQARRVTDAGHEFVFCGQKLTEEEKIERAKDADAFIITNGKLSADVINAADHLKMISVGFTGIDHVDLAACKAKDVRVCNCQGYATVPTGELAVGLMLACLRNIVPYDQVVRDGGTLAGYTHNTLEGKTVGILGTGAIGLKTAALCKAFGCNLIAYSRTEKQEALDMGIKYVDIDTLFKEADIISLHTPLTDETRCIVSRERIFSMKKNAILINCGRGGLVDSAALADALNEGAIRGAGIDVFEMEPPIPADHPLLHAKNCILTPHVGFYSQESLTIRVGMVMDNVTAWLDGHPINAKQ